MATRNKYKSKWEQTVADQIKELGFPVSYETHVIEYVIPESVHKYTPDFKIGQWYIEAKGKFDAQDRKKHLFLKEQYPKLKILLLFQNANQRISKRSNTTYGDWCTKNEIKWCHRVLSTKDLK